MTPQEFAYWLQGYAELSDGPPNEAQWKLIKDNLAVALLGKPQLGKPTESWTAVQKSPFLNPISKDAYYDA